MTTQQTPEERAHFIRWINGKEPNRYPDPVYPGRTDGRRWNVTNGFKDRAELAAAMADPRYKTDADYRQGIAEILHDSPHLRGTLGSSASR